LRSTTTVVYCSTDNLIGVTNKALAGFAEFLEGLGEANIPVVPVTSRSRLQFDATIESSGSGILSSRKADAASSSPKTTST